MGTVVSLKFESNSLFLDGFMEAIEDKVINWKKLKKIKN